MRDTCLFSAFLPIPCWHLWHSQAAVCGFFIKSCCRVTILLRIIQLSSRRKGEPPGLEWVIRLFICLLTYIRSDLIDLSIKLVVEPIFVWMLTAWGMASEQVSEHKASIYYYCAIEKLLLKFCPKACLTQNPCQLRLSNIESTPKIQIKW